MEQPPNEILQVVPNRLEVANTNHLGFLFCLFYLKGYVGFFEVYLAGKKLDFFLISRRSSKRAGTRYNSRGIDDEGNVSNYCETE